MAGSGCRGRPVPPGSPPGARLAIGPATATQCRPLHASPPWQAAPGSDPRRPPPACSSNAPHISRRLELRYGRDEKRTGRRVGPLTTRGGSTDDPAHALRASPTRRHPGPKAQGVRRGRAGRAHDHRMAACPFGGLRRIALPGRMIARGVARRLRCRLRRFDGERHGRPPRVWPAAMTAGHRASATGQPLPRSGHERDAALPWAFDPGDGPAIEPGPAG
jgi:hypothetical protein